MGPRWTRFFYLIVNFLSVFGLKLPQQPDPGFRYNCWDQTCTFPSQYCDIDEKRCLFCSDDLCKSGNFPEQCYSYCQVLLGAESTSVVTLSVNLTKGSQTFDEMPGALEVAVWLILAVLLIILIIIVVLVIMFCRSKHVPSPSGYKFISSPTDADEPKQILDVDGISKENGMIIINEKQMTSTNILAQPDSQISMSSGNSLASTVTQPEEVGYSRQHAHHIETELLKNSYAEGTSTAVDNDSGFTENRHTTSPVAPSQDFSVLKQSFATNQEDTLLKI